MRCSRTSRSAQHRIRADVPELDSQTINSKVAAIAEMVQLTSFSNRRVTKLSGVSASARDCTRACHRAGSPAARRAFERARSASARAHAGQMKRLQQRLGISFIYVTHNQSEAFSMADRIVVMDKGHIDQIGSPKQLASRPRPGSRLNRRANNIIDGKVQEGGRHRDGRVGSPDGSTPCCRTKPSRGVVAYAAIDGDAGHSGRESAPPKPNGGRTRTT